MAASLAKKLRAVRVHDDEERWDLANFTEVQSEDLVQQAFVEPIEVEEPIRLTFIIGGGKLVRQKYDEALGKWLTASLRGIGFAEDKGAALGSTEAFKMQHDLGQNLIYLHVFPRMKVVAPADGGGGKAAGAGGPAAAGAGGGGSAAPPDPLTRVVTCEVFDFHKLVPSRVPLWSHKRRLLTHLQNALKRVVEIEGKMATRTALADDEQKFYESTSRGNLEEKITWLHAQMKEQVSEGQLTAQERDLVLREMEEKLAALEAEAAKDPSAAKKAAAAKESLVAKRDAVRATFGEKAPLTFPVKGLADIRKLRLELARLDRLEATQSGKAVNKELEGRPAVQAKLAELAVDAKGWFEEEGEYNARVTAQLEAMGGAKALKGGGAAGKGGGKR